MRTRPGPRDGSPRRLRNPTLAWAFYSAFIVYGSLLPFQWAFDRTVVAEKLAAVPLNPLVTATGRHVSMPDVAQNVLLFLPFGWMGLTSLRPRRTRPRAAVEVLGLAMLLSVCVESAQLLTVDRTTSVTDVLADTTGAGLGCLARLVLPRLGRRPIAWTSWATRDRRAAFAMASAVALATLAAWAPYDPTFDVSTILSKIRVFDANPWQASTWVLQGGAHDAVRGLLLGSAVASWLPVSGAIRRATIAAALALAIVTALTLTEFLITTRQPGLAALSVESGGALAGVFLGLRLQAIGQSLWSGTIITAVAAGLALNLAIATTGWLAPTLWHSRAYAHDDLMSGLTIRVLTALAYAPVGFASARVGSTSWRVVGASAGAAIAAAALGPLERSAPVGAAVTAVVGTLAGGWTAIAGRRRFEAAMSPVGAG